MKNCCRQKIRAWPLFGCLFVAVAVLTAPAVQAVSPDKLQQYIKSLPPETVEKVQKASQADVEACIAQAATGIDNLIAKSPKIAEQDGILTRRFGSSMDTCLLTKQAQEQTKQAQEQTKQAQEQTKQAQEQIIKTQQERKELEERGRKAEEEGQKAREEGQKAREEGELARSMGSFLQGLKAANACTAEEKRDIVRKMDEFIARAKAMKARGATGWENKIEYLAKERKKYQ